VQLRAAAEPQRMPALYSKFESEQTFIEYRDCPGHKE
jgi:hypothetical protein